MKTYHIWSTRGFSLVAQMVKHLPTMWETWVRSPDGEDPLEKEMATHSSTLAWKIPWEKTDRLQSMGWQRVGHGWATLLHLLQGLLRWHSGKEPAYQFRRHKRSRFDPRIGKVPWRRKWLPISVFLPGKSHGQRSLAGYSLWGHKELDMTEQLNWTEPE